LASKRKYKDMKQDVPFELPEFDETEYLKEQVSIGKGVFVSVGWAVVMGALTFLIFFFYQDTWQIIFIPGALGLAALYLILPRFKVDLNSMNKKSWFNFVFAFSLAWLAVVIISLNPPFSDFADPILEDRTLDMQEFNATADTVEIRAVIRDNYRLEEETCTVTFPQGSGIVPIKTTYQMKKSGNSAYSFLLPRDIVGRIVAKQSNGTGPLPILYEIRAIDSGENEKKAAGSFIIAGENRRPVLREDSPPYYDEDRDAIDLYLYDNSDFKDVFFVVNRHDDEIVDDDERYEFAKVDDSNPVNDGGEYRHHFEASLKDFRKGDYNITITATDAANNNITTVMDFQMAKDGADVGKGGQRSMLPGFGIIEALAVLLVLFTVALLRRRERS